MPGEDSAHRGADPSMLIDTHCHLHRQEFDADREQVISRAQAADVRLLLDPATDVASNRTVVDLAQRYPGVYAAIGLHPHDAKELTPRVLEELALLSARPKVVAIGEIGLDYYRNLSPREVQQDALRKLLDLGQKRNLPVIIHCRSAEAPGAASSSGGQNAYDDLFPILRECLEPPMTGLLHCFAGDGKVAQEAIELGLHVSFAGNLTFPKAEALRAVATRVPLERVVLETDAPFLAPQAYRGQRNEPAFLHELVRAWAQMRNLTPEEISRETTKNACRLFRLPEN